MRRGLATLHAPLPYESCPTQAALAVLGRPWALAILTDVVFWRLDRFGELLAANPDLPRRTLSLRLGELVAEGVLRKEGATTKTRYALSAKGRDIIPVVHALMAFGMKHRAQHVFRDGRPRELRDLLPESSDSARRVVQRVKDTLTPRAARAASGRRRSGASRP